MDIFCSNLLNLLKGKSRKENQKILYGPSKIFKNVSWPINICLKHFMIIVKTLRLLPPPTYLMYYPLFIKSFIFNVLCEFVPIYSWFETTVVAHWSHLSSSLTWFIVVAFCFKPIWRISIWSVAIWIYFMTCVKQQINTI